jgi:hypothetical protein
MFGRCTPCALNVVRRSRSPHPTRKDSVSNRLPTDGLAPPTSQTLGDVCPTIGSSVEETRGASFDRKYAHRTSASRVGAVDLPDSPSSALTPTRDPNQPRCSALRAGPLVQRPGAVVRIPAHAFMTESLPGRARNVAASLQG